MGFFSKIAFWKKSDDPFGSPSSSLNQSPFPDQQSMTPQGMGLDSGFGQQGMQQGMQGMSSSQGYDPYAQYPPDNSLQPGMQPPSNAPFAAGPGAVPMGVQLGQQQQGMQGQPQYQDPQLAQGYGNTHLEKDLQIISLKLDTIKSELDVMKGRIERIEKIAETESSKTKKVEYGW